MVVFKYALANRPGYQEIVIPATARIVRVKLLPHDPASPKHADEQPRVQLWAIVDQSENMASLVPLAHDQPPPSRARETRTFSIEMTGDDRPYIKPSTYIGTYEDGVHVLHIFEVTRR